MLTRYWYKSTDTNTLTIFLYKPPFWRIHADPAAKKLVREASGASIGGKVGTAQHVGKERGLPRKVQDTLDSIPVAIMEAGKAFLEGVVQGLPVAHEMARQRVGLFPPAQRVMVEGLLYYTVPILQDIADKVLALLCKAYRKQVFIELYADVF